MYIDVKLFIDEIFFLKLWTFWIYKKFIHLYLDRMITSLKNKTIRLSFSIFQLFINAKLIHIQFKYKIFGHIYFTENVLLFQVKGCVKLLKDQPPCKSEGLLNALRYTTKHLNEENTPKNIKNLLAAWLPKQRGCCIRSWDKLNERHILCIREIVESTLYNIKRAISCFWSWLGGGPLKKNVSFVIESIAARKLPTSIYLLTK